MSDLQKFWVSKIQNYSSEKHPYTVDNILGPTKNYPNYGIHNSSWCSEDLAKEYIEIAFERKLYPKFLHIYECFNPGQLTKVSVKNPSGKWIVIYEGNAMNGIKNSRIFNPQLKKVDFKANEFRLDFEGTLRPICIDGIQFLGLSSEIDLNSYKDLIQRNQKKLSESYKRYLYSYDESDLTIFCGKNKEQFFAHKIILSCQSEFFREMFRSKCKESARSCVVLKNIEPEVFQHILCFMYCGNIIPDRMNITIWKSLIEVSDFLLLKNLKILCMKYIDNKSLEWIKSDDFLNISIYTLTDFVKSDYLKIHDEVLIYQRCIDWAMNYCKINNIVANKENISEILSEVFKYIRFTLFDPKYLKICEKSGYISKSSLIKIYKNLIKNQVENPRKVNDEMFIYKSDLDDNGIFYFLGLTIKENKKSWENPFDRKIINIYTTGHSLVNGSLSDIVGRGKGNVWINSIQSSSFVIDLQTFEAKVTDYTFKHFDQSCCYPKKWAFEGSNDASNWETLILHDDPYNTIISQKSQVKTFKISEPKHFFRYFRVINLAPNSSNWNFGLGGLEIYGELKKLPQ